MADPKIIDSPLSGLFSEGDVTVDVRIYRLEDTKWALEVVDSEGTSIVWDDHFETDEAARAEFHRSVAEEGLTGIVSSSTPTRH
jgi:hypothetical protein